MQQQKPQGRQSSGTIKWLILIRATGSDAGEHQRLKRNQCRTGRCIIGRLGCGNAFDLAVTEMITVFGGLFRLIVADKGCNAAACTRDSTHNRTNHRRDRHCFEAALDLCPRQLLMVQLQMLLTRCICTRIIIRAAEQFGNCEQTDQRNDQRDTGAQSTDTKGETEAYR